MKLVRKLHDALSFDPAFGAVVVLIFAFVGLYLVALSVVGVVALYRLGLTVFALVAGGIVGVVFAYRALRRWLET